MEKKKVTKRMPPLKEARQEIEALKKQLDNESIRKEIENYGLAFSRFGVGIRTAKWPYVSFVIGHEDIEIKMHHKMVLARGMYNVLESCRAFFRKGENYPDGKVDFEVQMDPDSKPVPRIDD